MARRATRTRKEQTELKKLGKRIHSLIVEEGHESLYSFWLHLDHDEISKAALSAIVRGDSNPKYLTLIKIAKALKTDPSNLLPSK